MGINIPQDRPLSDEHRAWLKAWSREEVIAQHDAMFPPGSKPTPHKAGSEPVVAVDDDEDGVDVDSDISDYAESLKVAELKEALKEHGIEFDSDSLKDELISALAIGLQDKRDAGEQVTVSG